MQLKGLVKFFTVALILISLYQLSFTFVARSVESKAHAQAERQAKAAHPGISDAELKPFKEARYDAITDSLQGEKVYNLLVKKFTYADVKSEELNLGLDLQGGMNVTLEVSLDELVRSMSNNPKDQVLDKAIKDANALKANSQADFVTLFGEAYKRDVPNGSLASLFIKPSEKDIERTSTNDQVLAKIHKEATDAIKRTYNVLLTRIDKFGVAQPNVNLNADKGIITVELAGVRDPERVRNYLQATASLQFFVISKDPKLPEAFRQADKSLEAYLDGVAVTDTAASQDTMAAVAAATDTAKATAANANDTSGLGSLLANTDKNQNTKVGKDTAANKNPLLEMLSAQLKETDRDVYSPAAIGYVYKKNEKKLMDYLDLDVVKSKMPHNVKFCFGAEDKNKKDPNSIVPFYALETASDGKALLEGDHITKAAPNVNQMNGGWEIQMDMDQVGAKIWKKITGQNIGNYVAVVLDDKVYSAPSIHEEISGGRTSISGKYSAEEATDLANILNTGKLPAPARIVQEQVVGPTLGAENIQSGMMSLAISFVIIFILMLVYYNTGGIVANIALILNLLFTVGILSALHATLTMPGIAGLVLTIGMAVDTNVIIFERIKEELAGGRSYKDAVAEGYKRSYAPVLDGHITQLLTAVILFTFGLGPVLGFATTQIIGLLLSLFCGILVSRLVTDIYTKRERHFQYFTVLSKSIFRKAHFKFIEVRKYAYMISAVVLLLGIGSYFHGFDYGVEFSGGRSYTIKFDQKHTVTELRDKLKTHLGNEYPVVKTIGTENTMNITTGYRIKESGIQVDQQVGKTMFDALKQENMLPSSLSFEEYNANTKYLIKSETVLPTISDDLKAGALKATIFSLIAIFIYILVRFRKWQYSLGTIFSLLHDVCVTLAVFSFLRGIVPFPLEIDQHFIAAILTVIGFSMNDTVIVFDRVREYFRKSPGEDKKSVINRAINDTLSRTIMTSLTVFLTILILFIFGGEATRGFAFAMLIGVVTGTYSSIFVAAPVLVDMDKGDRLKVEVDRESHIEELKKLA